MERKEGDESERLRGDDGADGTQGGELSHLVGSMGYGSIQGKKVLATPDGRDGSEVSVAGGEPGDVIAGEDAGAGASGAGDGGARRPASVLSVAMAADDGSGSFHAPPDEEPLLPLYRPKPPMSCALVLQMWRDNIGFYFAVLLCAAAMFYCLLFLWPPYSHNALHWTAWFSIAVTAGVFLLLLKPWFPASFVLMAGMTAVLAFGVISESDALSGFCNDGVATVGILFIVAKAVEESKALNLVIKYILRKPSSLVTAQLRLLVPVSFFSMFLNNTPIVAMMIPVVESWSVRCKLHQSLLLMPLSFAAILGGSCSIIGTSTNLIVAGLAQQQDPDITFGFFEIAKVGVPNLVVGLSYLLLTSRFLLPVRTSPTEAFQERRRYAAAVLVHTGCELIGKDVASCGFEDLGVTVRDVKRRNRIVTTTEAAELKAGDVLHVLGTSDAMKDVYAVSGLVPATAQLHKIDERRSGRRIVEAVLSRYSHVLGQTPRESKFRSQYNAAIIAIHKPGEDQITAQIGDIKLEAGDTLLLEASKSFVMYHRNNQEFSLINELSDYSVLGRYRLWKMIFVIVLTLAMIVASALELTSLLTAGFVVSVLFIIFNCIKMERALASVQGDLLLIIACAFGIGIALQNSGAAEAIADALVGLFSIAGDIGILFGLYITTAILSSVISNAATVSLMFPVAYSFVGSTGLSLKAITYVLMLSGSCCFATPIGYQTNIMVCGPGQYTTADFLRFGVPLTIVSMLVSVTLCYFIFN